MKLLKKIALICTLTVALGVFAGVLSACNKKDSASFGMVDLSSVNSLSQIQKDTNNLAFEWLRTYNPQKPTLIVFPGEYTDRSTKEQFSLTLDEDVYKQYSSLAPTETYVVYYSSDGYYGYNGQGINYDLSYYWLNVATYNVAIFHWERFADETDADNIIAKFFSTPRMRYKNADGSYETNAVPDVSLVELVSALYLEALPDTAKGNEIRFVGNGVGADLAACVAYYLNYAYNKGAVKNEELPSRLSLCDPYLSVDPIFSMKDWTLPLDTTFGMMSMTDDMLTSLTSDGVAVEMIETYEMEKASSATGKYVYDIPASTKAETLYTGIKSKVAYLQLNESYSLKIAAIKPDYLKLNRTALDWYLYSVIGSDDSSVGYPTNYTSENISNSNWGTNYMGNVVYTRPMLNDRKATNSSSRGKNFGVSAWTPTAYIRAMRGISFSMKESTGSYTSNVHNMTTYSYTPYCMNYFRTENYQKSDQTDYTLISGYVYCDANGDAIMNDGIKNGLGGVTVNFDLQEITSSKKVANFDVVTDETGYYVIKLQDKVKYDGGVLSQSGYSFANSHTVTLTCRPNSVKYYPISSAVTSYVYYYGMKANNFSGYTCSFTLDSYYADAITIKNCLVKLSA